MSMPQNGPQQQGNPQQQFQNKPQYNNFNNSAGGNVNDYDVQSKDYNSYNPQFQLKTAGQFFLINKNDD